MTHFERVVCCSFLFRSGGGGGVPLSYHLKSIFEDVNFWTQSDWEG